MDLRCSYPSKPCDNPRALRRDGRLHSFCEEHRQKANEAQKRWYDRHRLGRATPHATRSASAGNAGMAVLSDEETHAVEPHHEASITPTNIAASRHYGCVTHRSSSLPTDLVTVATPTTTPAGPIGYEEFLLQLNYARDDQDAWYLSLSPRGGDTDGESTIV